MNQFPTRLRYLQLAGLMLANMVLCSCDDAFIDPFDNDQKYYTVYGFLDQANNFRPGATHNIRISAITRRPEQITSPNDPQAFLDGRVFLSDLDDETTVEMYHTLEEIEEKKFGHIFRTSFFIQPGHRYRLEIRRSDGITTFAETTSPSLSSIRTIRETPRLSENETMLTQDLLLTGVKSLWSLDVIYQTGSCFGNSPNTVSYGRVGRATGEGWAVTINITDDINTIKERLQVSSINICGMGLRAQILDDDWIFPEGEIDIDIDEVALPEYLNNVENGYGFLGSLGLFQDDWAVEGALSELINAGE